MAQDTDSPSTDPEIKRLQEKSRQGALNVVGDILSDPKVQELIKKALVKETVKQAIIMSCLFIGLINLYGVAKQVIGFGWQIELVISLVLVLIGLIYMAKNVFNGKRNGK